jgi:RHS repeat-associated protein
MEVSHAFRVVKVQYLIYKHPERSEWAGQAASGLATCALEVREDEGEWGPFSTDCAGADTYQEAQPGHRYTFRLTASDNAGNEADTEVEATTKAITKYYYFGGQRVAMRGPDDALTWLHADHLGSTSLATDAGGGEAARQLYYPFGETRWASVAPLPTDFGFTGQRNQSTIGLYDYRARFYDPLVGRFVSADTIVPSPGDPQALNRYSYANNNPLVYVDPSGHTSILEAIRRLVSNVGNVTPMQTPSPTRTSLADEALDVAPAAGRVAVPALEPLALEFPAVASALAPAAPWIAIGATAVAFTTIGVVGFSESTFEIPEYEQPQPPDGGLGLTTVVNTTVMSEYGLWLTDQAATEIGDILHEMSRKQRGTGPHARQPRHWDQPRARVDRPELKPGSGEMPRMPGTPQVPRPEDLVGKIAYAMYVIAQLGSYADQIGVDNLLGMDWPFKPD